MAIVKEFETFGKHGQVLRVHDNLFPLYIVKGEKNFLVDSGVSARAEILHKRIAKALAESGPSAGGGIDTLLLTHSHWDHTGAAYYLQQIYGFNVMASRRTVDLLQKEKVIGFIDRLNEEYKLMQKDIEVSEVRFGRLERLQSVAEGDVIRVDADSYFEVIDTPGHTKCAVTYLLRPDNILFQGDSAGLLESNGSIKPIFLSSYSEYEASLRKLMAVEADAMAFPHNRMLVGKDKVKKYLQDSLTRTQEVRDQILRILKDEKDTAKIAEALYQSEFPITSIMGPKEAMMINLEAMIKAVASK